MKPLTAYLMSLLFLLCSVAWADATEMDHSMHDMNGMHDMNNMQDMKNSAAYNAPQSTRNSIELKLVAHGKIQADDTVKVNATLINNDTLQIITEDNLETVHTSKFHLLVVDSTLTDYQHIHPQMTKPGEWEFEFTPKTDGAYRAWANITLKNGKTEFVSADLNMSSIAGKIDKTPKLTTEIEDYTFVLALDGDAKAGEPVMAHLTVSKEGKPFTQLQPLMGAFAHMVGFNEDFLSVIHVHPTGKEPEQSSERGGPTLDFNVQFTKPGFVKLFAQVNIDGKDVYVPFGVVVK